MRLSVIIPAYNAEATLPVTLESLTPVDGHELEIIVVDDASLDATADVASGLADHVLVMERNSGPSIARNEGARRANGDVLLFIDSDVELLPDALSRVISTLEENPGSAGVAGNLSTDSVAENFIGDYKNLYMHFAFMDNARSTGAPYTSIAAVRREVFDEIGGFVDVLPNEDRIFDIDLARGGHTMLFDTDIQVRHHRGYGWWEFIRVEAKRAKNIVQLHLETRLLNRGKMAEHIPLSILTALTLTVLLPVIVGAGLIVDRAWLWLLPVTGLAFVGSMWPFVSFLRRHKGAAFALAGLGFAVLDMLICFGGAIWGMLAFLSGQRLIPK